MPRIVLVLALAMMCSIPAVAGAELALTIKDGRVTLVAENVTVRQILAEWARVGQTRIVNGERVSGPPVSIRLQDVPERQALAILLRSVSGYMAAPRPMELASASLFDRILIMPTSSAAPAAAAPGPMRPGGLFPQPQPQPPVEAPVEGDEVDSVEESPFAMPETGRPADDPNQGNDGHAVTPIFPGSVPPQQAYPAAPQGFPGAATSSARPGEIVAPPPQGAGFPTSPGKDAPRPPSGPPQ
jgi:hypothetical protein